MLNLNHLRVFRSVLETNSITDAARQLHISQPAASKQLAELEAHVGVTLLERLPRGVRLTAAGEVLSRHARRLFQEEEAAEAALKALLGLELGQVSLAASTTIGSYIVPAVFGELHAAHPRVRLQLEIGNATRVEELVLDGQLDLGLSEGVPVSESLRVEVFTHDTMVLIAAPSYPLVELAGPGGVAAQALEGVPFLVRERGSGTREVVEAALERRGLRVAPVMTLGSTEAIKNAVAQGLGVALVSSLTIELELSSGRLTAIPLADLSIRRALHLLTLEGKPPSPAAAEFLRLLRARHPR
ncbi:MAG TPA: LysR family transcriptional regulator [Polyangiaceae bacterium]|nr:LysR family transcriptional regulator [Polyangiaceae bacterium]